MDKETLKRILDRVTKEEGLPEDRVQPLYVDESEMIIKCDWCKNQFKGSCQLKHLNQHVNKSASHSKKRKQITEGGKQIDIRYFVQH